MAPRIGLTCSPRFAGVTQRASVNMRDKQTRWKAGTERASATRSRPVTARPEGVGVWMGARVRGCYVHVYMCVFVFVCIVRARQPSRHGWMGGLCVCIHIYYKGMAAAPKMDKTGDGPVKKLWQKVV
jgi:hypothetical protein